MNSARIAAWAVILTFVPMACATARPVTTTGDTNLRTSPDTNGTVLALIPKGTSIEVSDCSNGWCKTSYNGQDGYAIDLNFGEAKPHNAGAARPRKVDTAEPRNFDATRPRRLATAKPRRAPRGPVYAEEEIIDEGPVAYGPPAYVVGPPVYYGYRPLFGFYGGWGWGRHW